jgi:hypothetical protein
MIRAAAKRSIIARHRYAVLVERAVEVLVAATSRRPNRHQQNVRAQAVNTRSPHRTAPHRTAPHRTAPHRTAPHRHRG